MVKVTTQLKSVSTVLTTLVKMGSTKQAVQNIAYRIVSEAMKTD